MKFKSMFSHGLSAWECSLNALRSKYEVRGALDREKISPIFPNFPQISPVLFYFPYSEHFI